MKFDRAGFDREVGLRMQMARKAQRMTQEEMAKRIGLTRPSYASIESGRQRIPIDVVWRVAVVLSVSIGTLVPESLSRKRPHTSVVSILNPRRRRASNTIPAGHVSDRSIVSPATNFTRAAALGEDDG